MSRRRALCALAGVALLAWPAAALAEPIQFKVLSNYSRATFKTDAPLETVVGNTAGPGVGGALSLDPARPQEARGTIRVDLSTLATGIAKRDEDMRSPQYLDTGNEANRHAVFELRGVEIAGPLEPGRETPARLLGTLTIRGRAVPSTAEARVTWVRLTQEQLERDNQKRFGFTTDNLKVRARLATTFTNHGMAVPQLLILKLSNDIQLETDLTFVRAQ